MQRQTAAAAHHWSRGGGGGGGGGGERRGVREKKKWRCIKDNGSDGAHFTRISPATRTALKALKCWGMFVAQRLRPLINFPEVTFTVSNLAVHFFFFVERLRRDAIPDLGGRLLAEAAPSPSPSPQCLGPTRLQGERRCVSQVEGN